MPTEKQLRYWKSLKGKAPFAGKHHSQKTIEKLKEKRKLQITTDETRKKMSLARLGKRTNEDSWNWKGDNVGYNALHARVRKNLGKAIKCEHCLTKTAKKYEWANKSHKYLTDLSDWIQLCTSCHIKYDKKYHSNGN